MLEAGSSARGLNNVSIITTNMSSYCVPRIMLKISQTLFNSSKKFIELIIIVKTLVNVRKCKLTEYNWLKFTLLVNGRTKIRTWICPTFKLMFLITVSYSCPNNIVITKSKAVGMLITPCVCI